MIFASLLDALRERLEDGLRRLFVELEDRIVDISILTALRSASAGMVS